MANVLEKIVADKREEVAARKAALPSIHSKKIYHHRVKVYLRRSMSLMLDLFLSVKRPLHRKG